MSGYARTTSHEPLLEYLLECGTLKPDVAVNYSIATGGYFQIHKIPKSQMNSY